MTLTVPRQGTVQEYFIRDVVIPRSKADGYIKNCVALIHLVGSETEKARFKSTEPGTVGRSSRLHSTFPFLKLCSASFSYTKCGTLGSANRPRVRLLRLPVGTIDDPCNWIRRRPHERQLQDRTLATIHSTGMDRTTFTTEQELCQVSKASQPQDNSARMPRLIRLTVVPKGLRSFDASDSAFFLRLLPGHP